MYILFGEHPKRMMLATGSLCLTQAAVNDYREGRNTTGEEESRVMTSDDDRSS